MTNLKIASTLAIATVAIMLLAPAQGILRTAAADQNNDGPGSVPSPALCRIALQPADAISQTAVATGNGNQTFVKHAEKELFNCAESGTGDAFTFDVTLYQRLVETGSSENIAFWQSTCAVDPDTPAKLCQTNPIGHTTASTSACTEHRLAFPQEMNTVALGTGVVKTIESQKEQFYCSASGVSGTVIEDMVVWTLELDSVSATGSVSQSTHYMITDCTMNVSDAAQFSTNCESFGPFLLRA